MTIVKSKLENLPINLINKLDDSDKGFFCSFGWYKNFIDTVVSAMSVDYAFFYDSNNPSFLLPVLFTQDGGVRTVKSLANYYSPIYSVVNEQDVSGNENIKTFLRELKVALPEWDVMDLRPFDAHEASYLMEQLKSARMPHISYFCFGNWLLELDGRSFEQYYQGLSSQLRNTISRKAKKFFKMDGARIEIIQAENDLDRGFEAYDSVYRSSWKGTEPFPDFIPGLMKLAASREGLRLGIAYLDGKAIAAQLWIVSNGTAYIFKLAYDNDYKSLSVGSILTKHLMEYVIDVDKVKIVDYLTGDDAYKKDWMSKRRERIGVLVFNTSTFTGVIFLLKEYVKKMIKMVRNI